MKLFEKIDKESFGELLLIVGGFILAETIIKHFLDLAEGVLATWVLPLMAIATIFAAVELKNNASTKSFAEWVYWIFIALMLIMYVLLQREMVSNMAFLRVAFWGSIITIGSWLIKWIFLKKKNG